MAPRDAGKLSFSFAVEAGASNPALALLRAQSLRSFDVCAGPHAPASRPQPALNLTMFPTLCLTLTLFSTITLSLTTASTLDLQIILQDCY